MTKTAILFAMLMAFATNVTASSAQDAEMITALDDAFAKLHQQNDDHRKVTEANTIKLKSLEKKVAANTEQIGQRQQGNQVPPQQAVQLVPPAPGAIQDGPDVAPVYQNTPPAVQRPYPGRSYGPDVEVAQTGGYGQQTRPCQLDFTVFSRRLGRCVPR